MGDVKSSWSNIERGVRQGSILGPLLFSLFMNDLPRLVAHSRVKQYVDDTTIYQASTSLSDLSQHLTADLATVAGWVEQNGLILNETKTQLLLLSRKRRSGELRDVVVSLKEQEVQ